MKRCSELCSSIPGYKGRNTSERGRLVSKEPLMTAQELQDHLRRFVALDYHRDWHTGMILDGGAGSEDVSTGDVGCTY